MSQPDSPPRPQEDPSKSPGDESGSQPNPQPPERKSIWREPVVVAAIIAMISAVAVALIGVGFGVTKNQPSASTRAPTNVATSTATGPTTSSVLSVSEPSTSPQSVSVAWDIVYSDKEIDLPPIQGLCNAWTADLEAGKLLDGGGTDSDLDAMVGCGNDGVRPDATNGDSWGSAPSTKPTAQECLYAVRNNSIGAVSFDDFAPGNAYCMITRKKNIAWFKVVTKSGEYGSGFDISVTLWKPRT
ncbi:hypothetical protein [Nocardia alni]|uniref:hypothetical protein n=1 Tax=Nocardia alni TaxID=2815723 RepID=UPI001C246D56|nr:hypothetical protein [Nocardia alni]